MNRKVMAALAALFVLGAQWVLQQRDARPGPGADRPSPSQSATPATTGAPARPGSPAVSGAQGRDASDPAAAAFAARRDGEMMTVEGRVDRILADDHEGSRHQRFILATVSGHTVLVAHNIDLAPRLEGLGKGEMLRLRGQYEWSDRGGVLHWTHHDPDGSHPGGYIERNGRRYE